MAVLQVLQEFPAILTASVTIIGLMIGSFLNVVIYRLPVVMDRAWRRDCREYLELDPEPESAPFNLLLPSSCCPHCNARIKAWHNIPVFGYLILGGRCADCKMSISMRYPLIEAMTGLCSLVVVLRFGYGPELIFALTLTWTLIALSFIDIDRQLLPDNLTLPMLWLGLFLSLFTLFTDTESSIIGAIAGYLSLWTVYQLFKLATGKEGMGYGDFKLLALFGAWLGWQYLPMIILLSSLVGAVIGIGMVIFARHERSTPIPFGPYLAAAGWLALLWGEQINQLYLQTVGL